MFYGSSNYILATSPSYLSSCVCQPLSPSLCFKFSNTFDCLIVSPGPIQPHQHLAGYMAHVQGPSPSLFAYPFSLRGSIPSDFPPANLSPARLARLAPVPLSLLGFGAGVAGRLEVMGRHLCGCGMKPHGEAWVDGLV